MCAALQVYLTFVGGGAYGNKMPTILRSMARAIAKHRDLRLDVQFRDKRRKERRERGG